MCRYSLESTLKAAALPWNPKAMNARPIVYLRKLIPKKSFHEMPVLSSYSYNTQRMSINDDRLSRFSYWRQRYRQTSGRRTSFDWFLSSDEMLPIIQQHLEDADKSRLAGNRKLLHVLELGCGTSKLPLWLYTSSEISLHMVLTDFVQEALEFQQDQISHSCPATADSQAFAVCSDVCCLPFLSDSFSLAIDKGTMDALLKDRQQGEQKALLMIEEVMRVLHQGGRFIQISDEDPDSRLVFLDLLMKRGKDRASVVGDDGGPERACDRQKLSASSGLASDATSEPMDCLQNVGPNCNDRPSVGINESSPKSSYSSWCFQTILSESDQEYFLYWIDRLGT